jgi:hypothetical protein
MAKQSTTKTPEHSWSVYLIKGTPAKFIGIIYGAPNEQAALALAIKQYHVPSNQHDRLAARLMPKSRYT